MERTIRVTNAAGVHASPSAQIVQTVMEYNATVAFVHKNKIVDGRSILGILSLGLTKGTQFVIRAEGADAAAVLDALEELFASKFH
ncbi:MAG: HPr family phosphocarrier protein [Spirochaetota bacterium]